MAAARATAYVLAACCLFPTDSSIRAGGTNRGRDRILGAGKSRDPLAPPTRRSRIAPQPSCASSTPSGRKPEVQSMAVRAREKLKIVAARPCWHAAGNLKYGLPDFGCAPYQRFVARQAPVTRALNNVLPPHRPIISPEAANRERVKGGGGKIDDEAATSCCCPKAVARYPLFPAKKYCCTTRGNQKEVLKFTLQIDSLPLVLRSGSAHFPRSHSEELAKNLGALYYNFR